MRCELLDLFFGSSRQRGQHGDVDESGCLRAATAELAGFEVKKFLDPVAPLISKHFFVGRVIS